jgi:uncharacterized protein YceH (UPF0502 family)
MSESQNSEGSPQGLPTGPWPTLSVGEQRILGVLVEKQKTTPEVYPLSLNALIVGSNQKSNRDPVTELNEEQVDEIMDDLRKKGLAIKVVGGRVDRYRHLLYDVIQPSKAELAVLAELFLRGPQTEGELRTRASRMVDIPDLDSLKTHLRELKKRNLVQYLTPEDKRGAVVSHSLYEPATLEHLRRKAEGMGVSLSQEPFSKAPPAPPPPPPEWLARLDQLESRVESLEKELSALKTALGQ